VVPEQIIGFFYMCKPGKMQRAYIFITVIARTCKPQYAADLGKVLSAKSHHDVCFNAMCEMHLC